MAPPFESTLVRYVVGHFQVLHFQVLHFQRAGSYQYVAYYQEQLPCTVSVITDTNTTSTSDYVDHSSPGPPETLLTTPGDVIVTTTTASSNSSNDGDVQLDWRQLDLVVDEMRVLGPVLVVSGDTTQRFTVDVLFRHSSYNSASRCHISSQ